MTDQPEPILPEEHAARLLRISAIARSLGYQGKLEYRHLHSQSGGAQYCIGPAADDDIMVLYAKAFERDADPEEFNLDALIAHECGHHRLHRDPKFQPVREQYPGDDYEEILASFIGAFLLGESVSGEALLWRVSAELSDMGMSNEDVVLTMVRLQQTVEPLL